MTGGRLSGRPFFHMSNIQDHTYTSRRRSRRRTERARFAASEGYGALVNGNPLDGGSEVTTDVIGAGRPEITVGQEIDFGVSDGSATITWIAVYDAASSGNHVYSVRLPAPHTVKAGDTVRIHHGILTIT